MNETREHKRRRILTTVVPPAVTAMNEGAILWTILAYAMSNKEDCARFSCVSKEWNFMIRRLKPPVAWKVEKLLEKRNKELPSFRQSLNKALHDERIVVGIVREALEELKDINWSNRDDIDISTSLVTPRKLGTHVVFETYQRFLYSACFTSWNREKNSKDIYNCVCEHLGELAEKSVESVCKILQSMHPSSNDSVVNCTMWKLMQEWKFWSLQRSCVADLNSYLNNCRYVKEGNLPKIDNCADVFVVDAVRKRFAYTKEREDLCNLNNGISLSLNRILKYAIYTCDKRGEKKAASEKVISVKEDLRHVWDIEKIFQGMFSLISTQCTEAERSSMVEITTILREGRDNQRMLLKHFFSLLK